MSSLFFIPVVLSQPMSDIAGLKSLRAFARQPMPPEEYKELQNHPAFRLPKEFFLELEFEGGQILNVPLSEVHHAMYLRLMAKQAGVAVAQHVAAQGPRSLVERAYEATLALDASQDSPEVREALQKAARAGEGEVG